MYLNGVLWQVCYAAELQGRKGSSVAGEDISSRNHQEASLVCRVLFVITQPVCKSQKTHHFWQMRSPQSSLSSIPRLDSMKPLQDFLPYSWLQTVAAEPRPCGFRERFPGRCELSALAVPPLPSFCTTSLSARWLAPWGGKQKQEGAACRGRNRIPERVCSCSTQPSAALGSPAPSGEQSRAPRQFVA